MGESFKQRIKKITQLFFWISCWLKADNGPATLYRVNKSSRCWPNLDTFKNMLFQKDLHHWHLRKPWLVISCIWPSGNSKVWLSSVQSDFGLHKELTNLIYITIHYLLPPHIFPYFLTKFLHACENNWALFLLIPFTVCVLFPASIMV